MDQDTLQQYVHDVIQEMQNLETEQLSKNAIKSLAQLNNYIGNVKQYIHEVNTAMNGGDQFLIVKAANADVDRALNSLESALQHGVLTQDQYWVLQGKLSNLGMMIRSSIDPDYVQSWQ